MAFMDDIRVAYSGAGKVQSAAGTAQPQADLNVSFRAYEIRPFRVSRTERRLMNCSRSALQRKKTTTRRGELSMGFDGSPQVISVFLAYLFGTAGSAGSDPLTHTISRASTRNMRLFSLRVGADNGSDVGRIYKDCAVRRMAMRASAGPDAVIQVDLDIVCSADFTPASGTTWPACYDEDPAIMSDGDLVVGGVSKIDILQGFNLAIDPGLALGIDPFVNSIDVTRIRRSAETIFDFTYQQTGFPADADYEDATDNDNVGTSTSVALTIGPSGNRVTITFPVAYVGLDDEQVSGFGELNETALNMRVDPRDVDGDANSVAAVSAVIPAADQAAAFLVASS
jgi:hypothetical protein